MCVRLSTRSNKLNTFCDNVRKKTRAVSREKDIKRDFFLYSDNLPGKTLFWGDFNFPLENVENNSSRKLQDITVTAPRHNQSHLLDIVFSKRSDNILISTKLHHAGAILCKFDVSVSVQKTETFSHRCLKKD